MNPSSAPALAVALAGGTPTLSELVLMIEGDEDEVDEGMTEEVDVRVVTETLRALLLEALVDRTEVVDLAEVVEMTEEVDRATVVVITEPVSDKIEKVMLNTISLITQGHHTRARDSLVLLTVVA